MKFRPQVQLRFRDEFQFEQMKAAATAASLSLNEFVLRKLEAENGKSGGSDSKQVQRITGDVPAGVRQDSNGGVRGNDDPAVNQAGRGSDSKRGRGSLRRSPEGSGGVQSVKKLTAEQFFALSNSDQMKAKEREDSEAVRGSL